ncbi:V-set domain-containing T-cell activation inhibitor 1, partial [Halichoeres trimaculatus]|uniref:V-set domain-containing T-cell activation inhibitor 1 n=1 Tax=Halichoeres trimaculatus TaxID=147232 RepID=UPI003D9F1E80
MTAIRYFWILVVLILPRTFERGDAVPCTFMESCILPCTFKPGSHVLIHWIKQTDIAVHSYYRDKDQLANQNSHFTGRTKLFKDQLQKGNASLSLATVTPSDQGRYKCYTSTIDGNQDSAIDLNVEAPPREVSIKQEENTVTCSSERLFPQPTLTWTSSPTVTLAP